MPDAYAGFEKQMWKGVKKKIWSGGFKNAVNVLKEIGLRVSKRFVSRAQTFLPWNFKFQGKKVAFLTYIFIVTQNLPGYRTYLSFAS